MPTLHSSLLGGPAAALHQQRWFTSAAPLVRSSSSTDRCKCRRMELRVAAQAPATPRKTEEERIKEVRQGVTRRIKALGAEGKVREAIKELAGLAQLGVQPDTQAATALVAACVRNGNMDMAQGVFDELFGDFLEPDEVTFAVMLRGYGSNSPPTWPKIDATLTRMRMDFGVDPSATSYNALLDTCIRTNDLDRCMDVLDRMAADGVEPDDFTEAIVSRRRAMRAYMRKRLLVDGDGY